MDDTENLKWLWSQTNYSDHKAKILEGVAAQADAETLKWFWNQTNYSDHKTKILEGVAARADSETLKWFWSRTNYSDHKAKILEGVVARADLETLKWFWSQTNYSDHKDLLLTAMTKMKTPLSKGRTDVNEQKVIVKKQFKYDLFISHASEDKDAFVRPLATELRNRSLKVWYDEFTLSLGDSLRRSIDHGLAKSRYGLVILSKSFFMKEWPQKELDGLVAREDGKEKVILPIWHGISKEEMKDFSPLLSDRLAVSSDKGLDFIVNEIIKTINS